jgi:hypothetical protein
MTGNFRAQLGASGSGLERSRMPPGHVLAGMFGLTPTEAGVAVGIAAAAE